MSNQWTLQSIGKVCTLKSGKSVKKDLEKDYGSIPYLKVADMNLPENNLEIATSSRFLEEGTFTDNSIFPAGTTIFLKRGGAISTNKKRLTSIPVCTDLNIMGVIPSNKIHPKFLYYFFQTIDMRKLGSGSAVPQINNYDISPLKILVPPLEKQRKIVEILDEAFKAIALAEANTKKNLANARELFDSYLNQVFEDKANIFSDTNLGDLLELLTDYHANGSYKILKENVQLLDDGYAHMVRSTDFENNFQNNLKYITEDAYNFLSRSKIYGDEIIISKIGNAGKVYLMPEIEQPSSLAMNLFLLRVDISRLRSDYLYFFLKSNFGQKQIVERLNDTTTKTIRKDGVRSIKIPVPSISIQKSIVAQFQKLQMNIEDIENIYQRKLEALAELKQSILQKAFTGKLT